MLSGFGTRIVLALLLAAAAAVAVFAMEASLSAALVVLVAGVAAVLVAAGTQELALPPPEPPRAVAEPARPDGTAILEALAEPVLLVSGMQVTLANRAARRLLGEHVVGEDVRVAIRHPAAAERLTATDGGSDAPVDLVGLGALDQHWQLRVAPASTGQRIVQLVDQSGWHATERMRVDFVANASHELRTPLASILGYVETLRDEAGADEGVRNRFLQIMDDEARRMQRLIEDLISLSRIEADKYRLPVRTVDLAELVSEVHGAIAHSHDGRGRDVVLDLADDLPPIVGDRPQLSQMLHNLIGNAMKYGRAGTPVTIRLAQVPAGLIRLAVADEGEGIAPDHIPRLTERFYRVDAGRSRSLGGTGLGLAIVKHIVERHRGRLEIASVLGRGTTVSVLLPPAPVS